MSYTVKPGDTLSAIAARNQTTVAALLKANPSIANPDLIYPNQSINLPAQPSTPTPPTLEDALHMGNEADAQMCMNPTEAKGAIGQCSSGNDAPQNWLHAPLPIPADEQILYTPVPENEIDTSDFGKEFEGITGSKLSHTIEQYETDTGKTLSPDTVETLFTDPDKAKELLMADKSLHTTYRNILNQNVPATAEEAKAAGYTELGFVKSIFHAPWKNSKWVSPDGHLEGVYGRDGNLDSSNSYKGTFNFFGPDNASAHKAADVDPYFEWGN